MIRGLLVALTCLSFGCGGNCEDSTRAWRIVSIDAKTSRAIPYATLDIAHDGISHGAATGVDGVFTAPSCGGEGDYVVTIAKAGYANGEARFSIERGGCASCGYTFKVPMTPVP